MDGNEQDQAEFAASTHGLKRTLTARQLGMIGMGGAIGTGLFLGSGFAISSAGPAVLVSYLICALVALVIAWALAEMVVVHPTAGSFGVLAHSYIGRWAGFVVRWTYWVIQCIAIGGEVIAAGIFIQYWWPAIPLWLSTIIFSAGLLAVNATAVKFFGGIEYWFSMIKVSAIVVFIALGVFLIFFGLPGHAATGFGNVTSHGGFLPKGVNGVLLAMVFVIFSFIGTEIVSVTAAESQNPRRDVPRATRLMIVRLGIFYILAIAIVLIVVPWTQTAQVGSDVRASPFVLVFQFAGIPAAATIMNLVMLTAAVSSANANLYLTTRMLHSLAAHRYAPQWTGKLTSGGVPAYALILSSFGLVLAAIITVTAADTAYLVLFGIAVFGALVVWILILATHMRFRWVRARRGLPGSPVRLIAAPVTSGVALLFLVTVLISTIFVPGLTNTWIAGVPFFAVLLVVFFIVDRRTRGTVGRYDPLEDELARRVAVRAADQDPV